MIKKRLNPWLLAFHLLDTPQQTIIQDIFTVLWHSNRFHKSKCASACTAPLKLPVRAGTASIQVKLYWRETLRTSPLSLPLGKKLHQNTKLFITPLQSLTLLMQVTAHAERQAFAYPILKGFFGCWLEDGWICVILLWVFSVNLKKFKGGQCNFYPLAKTEILIMLHAPYMYGLTCNKPVLELSCNSGVLDPSACRLNTFRTVP